MLRIGLVSPYSLTVPGGVQTQVLGLARELRRRGHEARALGPCDGPPPAGFVTPLGNSVPLAANGSVAPLAPDPAAVLRTLRALRDEHFDVIHLHEPLAPGPTATATLLHAAPTVGTFHAAGTSKGYRMLRGLLRRCAERIDRRVVVSPDALELVRSHIGGEYTVLFNGVDLDGIRAVERTPSPHPTVFFCGRHEERKGLGVLIDAFADLPADAELWVASDGPDTDMLRRRTVDQPRIHWLGRISEEEKVRRLRSATVFCAPSLGGESFGVVLIEAMAAGAVVVASALDGYRNVATDDRDAVLVTPGDARALGAALAAVLGDEPRAERLRDAGTRRAQDFAMSTLASEYLGIYRALIRDVGGAVLS